MVSDRGLVDSYAHCDRNVTVQSQARQRQSFLSEIFLAEKSESHHN